MEARNITIVTTSNQNKYVVNTDATTLRELKGALSAQGISYDGMTFYEGLSHTELLTDDAVLPHDVPYKGNVTNELVFMLTLPNKKICSGITNETRAALYEGIEEYGLKGACIATYGKNFTQCKNSELMALIEDAQAAGIQSGASFENLEAAFRQLVNILEEDNTLYSGDAEAIRGTLAGITEDDSPKSSYSDEDIDKMFDFLG